MSETTAAAQADLRSAYAILQSEWSLSNIEGSDLLGIDVSSIARGHAALGLDGAAERMTWLLRIRLALRTLHSGKLAREWVRLPNSNQLYDGRPPLMLMRAGGREAILTVARQLTARASGA